MRDLHIHKESTSLQELHFRGCDIHAQSLADMLALPRALKRLTIGQNNEYRAVVNSPVDLNDYVASMWHQYQHLETLAIYRETEFRHSPLLLEKLSGLRRLEIDHRVLFMPLNTPARIQNAANAVTSILPPELEELIFVDIQKGDFKSLVLMLQTVLEWKAQKKIVPKLQRIVFRELDHLELPPWFMKAAGQVHLEIE
jgi:hypothetical protein